MKTKSWCLVLLLLAFMPVMAQKTNISPYSGYGLGSIRHGKFVRNYGMAGTGVALRSDWYVNPMNPASYTFDSIPRLIGFEGALEGSNTWLEANGQKQFQNRTYFSHIVFRLPVTDWWGMSFGMLPLTSVGYEYELPDTLDEIGRVTNQVEGTGGLNKVMVGNGFKLTDKLSVGFNASFLLGNLTYKERLIFQDQGQTFSTRKTDRYSVGDIYFDFGLQFTDTINRKLRYSVGATFAYADDINARQDLLVQTYTGRLGVERIKDTVAIADRRTTLSLPNFYAIGFALQGKDEKYRDRWLVTLDVDMSDWSIIKFNNGEGFSDAYSVRSGVEITNYYSRKKKGSLRESVFNYRFGGRYSSSYITLGGDPVTEIAASMGISLHNFTRIAQFDNIRGINFGIEVGMRGKDDGAQINERFVNMIIGITLNEKWFIKKRYY